jgi:hypothetical protein
MQASNQSLTRSLSASSLSPKASSSGDDMDSFANSTFRSCHHHHHHHRRNDGKMR